MPAGDNKTIKIPFPTGGIDVSQGLFNQRPGTSPFAVNVRGYDATGRLRGGSRSGINPFLGIGSTAQVAGFNRIQSLSCIVTANAEATFSGISSQVSIRKFYSEVDSPPTRDSPVTFQPFNWFPGTSPTITAVTAPVVGTPDDGGTGMGTATFKISTDGTTVTVVATFVSAGFPPPAGMDYFYSGPAKVQTLTQSNVIFFNPALSTISSSWTVVSGGFIAQYVFNVFFTAVGTQPFQLSESGRIVTAVASSQGIVAFADAGNDVWTLATNSSSTTPPLSATNLNFGAASNGKLWMVDGIDYRVFDPETGVISDWVASAGSLPVDADGLGARGIEAWRGRIVLFAVPGNPYDWYMAELGDPTNLDYAPLDPPAGPGPTPTDAVSSQTGPQGQVGDIMTGFIPFNDDVAFMACSHTLYLLQGDPQDNGQISLITDAIGLAFGRAWCKGPDGTVYFFSNRCGLYSLTPGQQPQRISQSIDPLVRDINTGLNRVTMMWNETFQGVQVWITPIQAPGAATHLFFEQRTGAWWQEEYEETLHNPLCACQFDGNNPEDRCVLIGSWDGVVRLLDQNAVTDDGRPIQSNVVFPPILSPGLDDVALDEIQAVMGEGSSDVTWNVLVGRTAEEALKAGVAETGIFEAGRNATAYVGRRDHALYVQFLSQAMWRFDEMRAVVRSGGPKSARAKD